MNDSKKYHLIGIGGSGMSAIARVLHSCGLVVTGSDRTDNSTAENLRSLGITVHIGHCATNVGDADCVVYSAAVLNDNPELVYARQNGIETHERSEMLGRLMNQYPVRIAVTGTHGKTTTTSLLDHLLHFGGIDPTSLIGSDIPALSGNARCGGQRVFVAEACEAFSSFLHLDPTIAVITNVDADHLDYYGSMQRVYEAFSQFVKRVDPAGLLVLCSDSLAAVQLAPEFGGRFITYGLQGTPDYLATNIIYHNRLTSFDLLINGVRRARISINLPGEHNVLNSLAAIAVAMHLGVDLDIIVGAFEHFSGAGRRFEIIYDSDNKVVVDDYAHHPAEIKALLQGAKSTYKMHTIAVFQPHLYSRTKYFLDEFADALMLADEVLVTSAYAAREKLKDGVDGDAIVEKLRDRGHNNSQFVADKENLVDEVLRRMNPKSITLFIGAGDINTISAKLVAELGEKP